MLHKAAAAPPPCCPSTCFVCVCDAQLLAGLPQASLANGMSVPLYSPSIAVTRLPGDAGLRLICDGLKENKSVTALDLPDNNITDVGAAILAEAIKDNPSLTQLQLAYNKIGDQGAIALAQVGRELRG